MMCLTRLARSVLLVAFAVGGQHALAQEVPGCGNLRDSAGPYDYRTVDPATRNLVERFHFTPQVEQLVGGQSGHLGGDLEYTLRAMPNHHRALISAMTYGQRLKLPQLPNARFPIECYFRRALQFAPDDTIARLLYATYLFQNKRDGDADKQIAVTIEIARDNGFAHYNIGMVLAEFGRYDQALQQSHRATELGFERPQLREILVKAGKWREPQGRLATPSPAASASSESRP